MLNQVVQWHLEVINKMEFNKRAEHIRGQEAGAVDGAAGARSAATEDEQIRAKCVVELNLYLSAAQELTIRDVPPDGGSIAEWWQARRHEDPKLPLLVEVFKNGFGKTMSSAVLENDFKKTAKSMPTDRNALGDAYYAVLRYIEN